MTDTLNDLYIGACVVLLFGAAIFVHEFGHYWVARRRGLKVEAFALGFGPKIFAWTRDGIEYSVRWIPAGGFVKLPQMVTAAAIEGDTEQKEMPPASPLSKILVAFAGPLMNVVFAFAIASLIYFVGLPVAVNPSIIGYVDPASPEGKLGIGEGDRIVAVNGKPVKSWDEVYSVTMLALTNVIPVTIERQGRSNTYLLTAHQAQISPLADLKTLDLSPRDPLVIKNVQSGSPAEKSHLQIGDEIIGFAGVPVSSFKELTNLVQKCADQATPIIVKRAGHRVNLAVTPATDPATKHSRMGVEFGWGKDVYELEHPTPWAQISGDFDQMLNTISALIHSRQSGVKARDLSGPVGIIGMLAAQVSIDYRLALNFLVLLNINLAILNLLPVPVLDGGHILMAIIERIRRRPLEVRFVEYTTTAFAVLLISFMLYVTFFDIKRISIFRVMFKRDAQIEQADKPLPAQTAQPEKPLAPPLTLTNAAQ
jgi:regulator of sigma E protease